MKRYRGRSQAALPVLLAGLGGFPELAGAADPWPAGSGTEIGQVGEPGRLPAGYEPSGAVWHDGRSRLLVVSDDGLVSEMTSDGDSVFTWDVGGNLEAIALPDPDGDLVLLGIEHPDTILEFDLATGTLTGNTWDLTPWMTGPANRGLEALTLVGPIAYAGHQDTGEIFLFQLLAGGSVVHHTTLPAPRGFDGVSGLDFDPQTSVLYALHDKRNRLFERKQAGPVFAEYSVPGDDQEGFALISGNAPGTTQVFIAQDPLNDPPAVWRYSGYPCDWPPATSVPGFPAGVSRFRVSPNPFRRAIAIRLDLAEDAFVTVAIHDILGRRVRVLTEGVLPAAGSEVSWDGRDERGRAAAAGLYLVRLSTPTGSRSIKVTRID